MSMQLCQRQQQARQSGFQWHGVVGRQALVKQSTPESQLQFKGATQLHIEGAKFSYQGAWCDQNNRFIHPRR